ncbi:hypothetical protein ABB02_01574 [Clostridiaceae bacterium JG1575]|nr:hypothetical protein ABB02_01574 [Clostridiaceae bacterium JG1575]
MNRTDVVAYMAQQTSMSKKRTEEIVCLIVDTMKDTLVEGEKVQITGFGTFEVKDRAPRVGRNPKTNEEVRIEAFRKPVFRACQDLRARINK